MNNKELISLALPSHLIPYLVRVKQGECLADYVMEELQDRGYISHKNELTAEGSTLIARAARR